MHSEDPACIMCTCSAGRVIVVFLICDSIPQRIDAKQEEVDSLKESLQERKKEAEEKVRVPVLPVVNFPWF